MGVVRKLFFLLLAANAIFLGYDYYQGGKIALDLVNNARNMDKEKLNFYINEVSSPQKLAGYVNSAFAQLKNINSPMDIVNAIRQKSGHSAAPQWEGNVLVLTDANFDAVMNGAHPPALIEFYAPWCGHCKNLAPTYAELGDAFALQKDKVLIAKFDADSNREVAQRYGIQGFPTLKWFPQGVTGADEVEQYQGGRDLTSLANFVRDKSGVAPRIRAQKSDVITLNTKNFHDIALDPKKNVFVEFYASWCGHCKNLAPIWEKLGTAFANEENCVIAKIDADKERDIGTEFEIQGFPTIKFFPAGESDPISYEGPRTEAGFIEFLNEKCGTQRKVGGGVEATVGRIRELDELAIRFMKDVKEREQIHSKAVDVSKKLNTRYAKYYAKMMEKMIEKGDVFLNTEKARLTKIASSDDIVPSKLDDFNIRQNILAVFDKKATPVEN
ncbi:thioredoxin-like protein [Mycotypha africana]|uniref:thioredoxin-like protein n=1 Tax=Mycotypha africana TaxID=64632 RepID=UPI0023006EF8|nr:thioredoxin-like protein [Mycotypha africana]KAI8984046.1 thioredoxin-like protein [Mycotypha africana]